MRRVLAEGENSRDALEHQASSSDDDEAARALYALGEMDEEAMRFGEAVAHYDASLARLPSSRYAQSAAARSSTLKAHSEGDYGPLTRVEAVRRDPQLASSPEVVLALVEAASTFPPGRVRTEARLFAAEAYRGRLHRPREQVALLWQVVQDPYAGIGETREAATGIVVAELAQGDLDAAERARIDLGSKVDEASSSTVARLLKRRTAITLAKREIQGLLLLFALAVARRGPRPAVRAALRVLPVSATFALFVGAGGGLLANGYEAGTAAPFVVLASSILVVVSIARAWGAVGSRRAPIRVLRAVLCASSLCSLTLLLLDRLTPEVLEGLGL
jgi:hypothetical protein